MFFRQFLHASPIAASYLFGCTGRRQSVVVDPLEDIEPYQQASHESGTRIVAVIDTHVHADHLSGGRALATAVDSPYLVHESAAVVGATALEDDKELIVGNVSVRIVHTPGHTPEHICLAVSDRTRASEPWMILTGHTLMAGDMGRTELTTSAEEGARALFESAARLRAFPDYVEIWPGAFAGSVCGRHLSGKAATTIGFERRFNRAFHIEEREAFVRQMLAEVPPRPPNADAIRAANLGHAPMQTAIPPGASFQM